MRALRASRSLRRAVIALGIVALGLAVALAGSAHVGKNSAVRGEAPLLPSGSAAGTPTSPTPNGPPRISHGALVVPTVFNGSVRSLPRLPAHAARLRQAPMVEREVPGVEQLGLQMHAESPRTLVPAISAPAPEPILSFNGQDYRTGWIPPDPVGDVGQTYFVQGVNDAIQIYRKIDGFTNTGFTFNALWSAAGSGTACDGLHNRGDPTVIYDPMANRWIIGDMAFVDQNAPPFYECIAVSRSDDPINSGWYLYPIRVDDASHPWFGDYPKMGIWPDGLYMTANMFEGNVFKEVRAWAFNRADLEAGVPLRSVVVDVPNQASLLPSNMRTVTGSPPAGRENLLVSEAGSAFRVFKFHPDYAGGGTTFTGPTEVAHAAYPFISSIPTPGNTVDSLGFRLMMQAQYTNIGGAESLWVNHTVANGASAGIQWAQIDVTGGTIAPVPVQQQLYPATDDGLSRWMGSLAVDRNGDLALGYSVANAATNPDIRYAGRLSFDPFNAVTQTETTLLPGVTRAAQVGDCGGGTCRRWGDYSAMTLDPDGCSFWYTQEYYETNDLHWLTRIGSFRFPACLKTNQSISFGALPDKAYGDADFTVSAAATSGLALSLTASGACTITGATVHITDVGSCTITAAQAGDGTYNPARSVTRSFSIAKGSQTITFAAPAGTTFGDADFDLGATASSGLPVAYAAAGSCTVNGASVHLTSAGSCSVTASQAGNANYNAATDVAQSFSIAKADQTIAFAPLANKRYGDADFNVSATSSAGLPVSFSASRSCTVAGTRVHLTSAGFCTVTATQAGDANHNAAPPVSRTFSISRAPCTVPKVVGKRLAAAKAALARRHCATGKVANARSARKKGTVISQSRRAGQVRPPGTKVNLVVSRGRRP